MRKQYRKAYIVLVEGAVDYEGDKPVRHIFDRFNMEYKWAIERYGFHKALTDWLAGLALNIPYTYDDIEAKFGIPQEKAQNYFAFMAMRLNELFRKEGLVE